MAKRYLLALLGCMALMLNATAQDEAPDPPADAARPPPARAPDGDEPAADGAAADESGEAIEEEEFIFSEEIPADQQVTFPVDI